VSSPIAIVGMACRYPDANTVDELFENSLAQRRSFREIPAVRLPAEYFDDTGQDADRGYARQAAVIKGFEFDRRWFKVPRRSFEVTDLAHWLALTVARETIEDIRFRSRGVHPHHDAVRVVVADTLTGEFSRASLMRLRWPYVRRLVAQQMRQENPHVEESDLVRRLRELEVRYKRPFPVPNEDFLAGGLANTIAGRICNHFDFKGGGYTVDGACASSLLAVSDACSALVAGDADMVLAGGVDLSLDPFELVGFSRSEALAKTEMFVYDERSEGFWPGEGCGFVALMRYADAVEQCERIHAVIHGWGTPSSSTPS
jgi:enediyne polyketide synthase